MRVPIHWRAVAAALTTVCAAAPAAALVNAYDDAQALPPVTVVLNVDRFDEAFELQTIAEKFWAEAGQLYDGMGLSANGGEYRASSVYVRFCLPACGSPVLQDAATILRRPRETFRAAFSRAFRRGELSQRLSSGAPGPGGLQRIGDYGYGTTYCIYGECGLGGALGGTAICIRSRDARTFCLRT
jgi:hypothetical protein